MTDNIGVKNEMDVIRKALREDAGYYIAWQANIAMAFKDEYDEFYKFGNGRVDKSEIHDIANNAAKNFLDLLIKE